MHIEEEIRITASPDRVWSVVADLENWPTWAPTFRKVQRLKGEPGVGAIYYVQQPKLPPSKMIITRWQPGHGFTWTSRSALLAASADHAIEPDGPGVCRIRLMLAFEGLMTPLIAPVLRKMATTYVRSEAENLKRFAELAGPAIPRP